MASTLLLRRSRNGNRIHGMRFIDDPGTGTYQLLRPLQVREEMGLSKPRYVSLECADGSGIAFYPIVIEVSQRVVGDRILERRRYI